MDSVWVSFFLENSFSILYLHQNIDLKKLFLANIAVFTIFKTFSYVLEYSAFLVPRFIVPCPFNFNFNCVFFFLIIFEGIMPLKGSKVKESKVKQIDSTVYCTCIFEGVKPLNLILKGSKAHP